MVGVWRADVIGAWLKSLMPKQSALAQQLKQRFHAIAFAGRALQQRFDLRTVAELHWRAGRKDNELSGQVARDLPFVFE